MNTYIEMSAEEFDDKYREKPVWDTGRPQKAFVDRFTNNPPQSPVLDVGCGSGDLARYVASLGCDVLGVDFSSAAIEQAKLKAHTASLKVAFQVQDIFTWQGPDKSFKTVLDCCFFHVLSDSSREKYESFLRKILTPGGCVYMLCFAGEIGIGPRAIRKSDIEETFRVGWSIESIEESVMEVSFIPPGMGMPGTFAALRRESDARSRAARLVAHHGVEDREDLSHAGGNGDLLLLATLS